MPSSTPPTAAPSRCCLHPRWMAPYTSACRTPGSASPPSCIDKIFDRFYRADPVRNRNSGGFGLGLSIAQWIVSAHSAEISVTSSLNQGSTFTVRFPQYFTDPLISSHTEQHEAINSSPSLIRSPTSSAPPTQSSFPVYCCTGSPRCRRVSIRAANRSRWKRGLPIMYPKIVYASLRLACVSLG